MNTFKHRFYSKPLGIRILMVIGFVILGAAGAAGLAILFGYVVMLLWNWLMPVIFGLGTITFWQAVGIIILARLIFGGFKHGGHSSHSKSKKDCVPEMKKHRHPEQHRWEYYEDYWREEGKDSFDHYVQKKNQAGNQSLG